MCFFGDNVKGCLLLGQESSLHYECVRSNGGVGISMLTTYQSKKALPDITPDNAISH